VGPTCKTQGGHALKLGLLQPLPHAPEGFAPRLELAPRLWVAQEVGQCALAAAQHALGENGLWDAVALQLGRDAQCQILGV